jgi:hypothetical protein
MAGFLRQGAALGLAKRAELAGPVVADRVDPDHLDVSGDLDRPGDDGHLDRLSGPSPPGPVGCAGEADRSQLAA